MLRYSDFRRHIKYRDFGSLLGFPSIRKTRSPNDIALLITRLDEQRALNAFITLPEKLRVSVFAYLPFEIQRQMIKGISKDKAIQILNHLESDDRFNFFSRLESSEQYEYLELLTQKAKLETLHFIEYPSNSIALLVNTEFITLQRPPYTDAENESNALFRALCKAQGAVWEADDLQSEKILAAEAKRRIMAEPLVFVKKTLIGVFTFWYQMTSLPNSLAAGAMAIFAWFFAAFGLVRSRREGRPAWLVLAPVVYLNLLLAALLSLGRYSVPVLPSLLVLSAAGLDWLLERRRQVALGAT